MMEKREEEMTAKGISEICGRQTPVAVKSISQRRGKLVPHFPKNRRQSKAHNLRQLYKQLKSFFYIAKPNPNILWHRYCFAY
jgi:hypothetical protein